MVFIGGYYTILADFLTDSNKLNAIGYEFEQLPEYDKYCGRLIVKFKNKSQDLIRLATFVMDECEVSEILPEKLEDDDFPGCENRKTVMG